MKRTEREEMGTLSHPYLFLNPARSHLHLKLVLSIHHWCNPFDFSSSTEQVPLILHVHLQSVFPRDKLTSFFLCLLTLLRLLAEVITCMYVSLW